MATNVETKTRELCEALLEEIQTGGIRSRIDTFLADAGARAVIGDGHALHLDAFAITDMLVALALGLFTTQRIEMYLRAKRMLETARVR